MTFPKHLRKPLLLGPLAIALLLALSSCGARLPSIGGSGKQKPGKDTAVMTIILDGREREIELELYPDYARNTVANFKENVRKGRYDGLAFHRIVPNFLVQTGDPASKSDANRQAWGLTNTGTIPNEPNLKHVPGALAMARRPGEEGSSSTQFYITLIRAENLDADYTVFGKVATGLYHLTEAARQPRDANDVPVQRIEIKEIELIRSEANRPGPPVSHTRDLEEIAEDAPAERPEPPKQDSTATKFLKRIW